MFIKAFEVFNDNSSLFLNGAKNTLIISLVATTLGLFLGFGLSMLRNIQIDEYDNVLVRLFKKLISLLTMFYIEFVRGTPMMVQAVFVYYGLYKILRWTPMVAGILVVSFNTAAYMAEIMRSGIQSVERGQSEAGLALGMKRSLVFRKIVLPQAIKNAFPSIGNEFVVNIKDTSVLNAIQVTELYYQTMANAGRTNDFTTAYFIALIIYFILTFTVTRLLMLIEKKLQVTRKTTITSQTMPGAL
ncbi:MAG: amino acid ABC transporter permease [Erysipelothrix sp.]|nr:amino acid ABC transporter permease [Erysipelothrix sp.]